MTEAMMLYGDVVHSPLGELVLLSDGAGRLRALDFDSDRPRMARLLDRHYGSSGWRATRGASAARQALERYFAGDVTALDKVKTATGGTDFQRAVWTALRGVPAGETVSYGEIATRIGRPSAVRAVGLAIGANPVAIVVPCHRIIGASGRLTGYAGGLERKRWLLAHEARGSDLLRAA